ncbi:MAG: lexA [Dehalococcoidia bacterium]|nr:lexA [Dehalococcoidia bacterium]
MQRLSTKQQAILEFVQEFHDQKGYAPSMREILQACNLSSTSVVEYNLRQLEEKGLLRRDREISRGINLPGDSGSQRMF